jgi:hypothetical protein
MTTVYDPRLHQVRWTEGLSYAEHWVDDHLHKINILMKSYDELIYKKPVEIANELEYFFLRKSSTCCVMYLNKSSVTQWLHERRFLYGNISLEDVCSVASIGPDVRPPSFLSSLEAVVDDIYNDIFERDEDIDQLLIIRVDNYESLIVVLDDDQRDVLMTRLHTPEQPVELNEEELFE